MPILGMHRNTLSSFTCVSVLCVCVRASASVSWTYNSMVIHWAREQPNINIAWLRGKFMFTGRCSKESVSRCLAQNCFFLSSVFSLVLHLPRSILPYFHFIVAIFIFFDCCRLWYWSTAEWKRDGSVNVWESAKNQNKQMPRFKPTSIK